MNTKRPYKIKHTKSGFYYRPGQINLVAKGGKIYNPGPDALTYFTNSIPVRVNPNSKQHIALKEIYGDDAFKKCDWRLHIHISSSEFEKEYV